MKSSDEIKKAMLHCSPVSCRSDDCPYKDDTPKYEGDMPVCRMKLWHDMVCLIQQLEAERDALLKEMRVCIFCDRDVPDACPIVCEHCILDCPCKDCVEHSKWQRRGVQKEE